MQIDTKVTGVRESLRTLGKIDKDLRRETVKKVKAAGSPLVSVARTQYPTTAPLSGMANAGRLQYQPGKVRSQVMIKVGGRTPKRADSWAIVTLQQNNAAAQLYSVAGMRNNSYSRAQNAGQEQFSANLEKRFGKPQRGMWRKRREIQVLGERFVLLAVKQVEFTANRALSQGKGGI
jgi:hypothetical protein